jgi:hypothetical protein
MAQFYAYEALRFFNSKKAFNGNFFFGEQRTTTTTLLPRNRDTYRGEILAVIIYRGEWIFLNFLLEFVNKNCINYILL